MDVSRRIELIGRHMVEILIKDLREGKIALERVQQIAGYYLDKLSVAGTHTELDKHVQTMLTEMPEMHMIVRSDKMRQLHKRTNT